MENPWLNELGQHHPYAYNVMVHTRAAERAGIREGDPIWLETAEGLRVRARAKLSECIHPEVVAVAGNFGHWSRGRAIAKGQGVHFNSLMALNWERIDMISGGMDSCVKVRIYR